MQPNRLYLLHPRPQSHPLIAEWIIEVEQILRLDESWDEWDIISIPYNERDGFDVQPVFARVLRNRGPVLLLRNVLAHPLGDLSEKLRNRAVVLVKAAVNSDDLLDSILEARRRHEAGEPLLARKLIVAVLIVRKLRARHYWGGKDKGYLWASDLAKGRGVDERFADIAPEVANDLLLTGILVKKTSQGQPKYALNQDRKSEVHAIADHATFQNKQLERVLMRDHQQEAAAYLHNTQEAQGFTIIPQGSQPRKCITAREAIGHIGTCPDGVRYEAIVIFPNDQILRDVFEEKRILLQFLEAFL